MAHLPDADDRWHHNLGSLIFCSRSLLISIQFNLVHSQLRQSLIHGISHYTEKVRSQPIYKYKSDLYLPSLSLKSEDADNNNKLSITPDPHYGFDLRHITIVQPTKENLLRSSSRILIEYRSCAKRFGLVDKMTSTNGETPCKSIEKDTGEASTTTVNELPLTESPSSIPLQRQRLLQFWVSHYDRPIFRSWAPVNTCTSMWPTNSNTPSSNQALGGSITYPIAAEFLGRKSKSRGSFHKILTNLELAPPQHDTSPDALIPSLQQRLADVNTSRLTRSDDQTGEFILPDPRLVCGDAWLVECMRIIEMDLTRLHEHDEQYTTKLNAWRTFWQQTWVFKGEEAHYNHITRVRDWTALTASVKSRKANLTLRQAWEMGISGASNLESLLSITVGQTELITSYNRDAKRTQDPIHHRHKLVINPIPESISKETRAKFQFRHTKKTTETTLNMSNTDTGIKVAAATSPADDSPAQLQMTPQPPTGTKGIVSPQITVNTKVRKLLPSWEDIYGLNGTRPYQGCVAAAPASKAAVPRKRKAPRKSNASALVDSSLRPNITSQSSKPVTSTSIISTPVTSSAASEEKPSAGSAKQKSTTNEVNCLASSTSCKMKAKPYPKSKTSKTEIPGTGSFSSRNVLSTNITNYPTIVSRPSPVDTNSTSSPTPKDDSTFDALSKSITPPSGDDSAGPFPSSRKRQLTPYSQVDAPPVKKRQKQIILRTDRPDPSCPEGKCGESTISKYEAVNNENENGASGTRDTMVVDSDDRKQVGVMTTAIKKRVNIKLSFVKE